MINGVKYQNKYDKKGGKFYKYGFYIMVVVAILAELLALYCSKPMTCDDIVSVSGDLVCEINIE